jgi:hypothetical protein
MPLPLVSPSGMMEIPRLQAKDRAGKSTQSTAKAVTRFPSQPCSRSPSHEVFRASGNPSKNSVRTESCFLCPARRTYAVAIRWDNFTGLTVNLPGPRFGPAPVSGKPTLQGRTPASHCPSRFWNLRWCILFAYRVRSRQSMAVFLLSAPMSTGRAALAIYKKIIKHPSGQIRVESTVDESSPVHSTLPGHGDRHREPETSSESAWIGQW